MNAATKTIVMTSTTSAVLIAEYVSTEKRGSSVLRLRAARTRMKVLMGINSSAKTSAKSPIFTQKKPLHQDDGQTVSAA